MKLCIRKAVVLGAGVMGASIAGHLAGNGIRVVLLDMPLKDGAKNQLALNAKKKLLDPKSRMLYAKTAAENISIGNFEDDLHQVADADWVIEAIVERLEPKVQLFEQVARLAGPGCILSSNTSGISMNAIAQGVPERARSRFIGTHFFNPPRYMKLLELIPVTDTDPALTQALTAFAQARLGKSVVVAQDTPNFIANRIGVANTAYVLHGVAKYGVSMAAADVLTGKLVGRPAAGTLRTSDLVGFDIVKATTATNHGAEPLECEREVMTLPPYFVRMMELGAMGDKGGKGFFTKGPNREALMWDTAREEYIPRDDDPLRGLKLPGKEAPLRDRVMAVLDSGTPEGDFLWYILKGIFTYSANRVPEITPDFRKIDLAMQLGYNWSYGPFQLWQALGAEEVIARIERDGTAVAPWVAAHLKQNGGRFYGEDGFAGLMPEYLTLDGRPTLWQSEDVTLTDLGDGVGAIVLHTPNASISERAARNVVLAVQQAQAQCDAAVLTSSGKHFCAGANLKDVLGFIEAENWSALEESIVAFQQMTGAIQFASIPVVAAAFGSALGGGAELCLHAHQVVAHQELNMGLVEARVGLVPAGGGLKELAIRTAEPERSGLYTLPLLRRQADVVAGSTVSSSALHAVELGLLRPTARLVAGREQLLQAAKEEALALAKRFIPRLPQEVSVHGETGMAAVMGTVNDRVLGGFITQYDGEIAKRIAHVLTGGPVLGGTVSEETLLRLEREAFVALCQQEKTRQRIEGMLSSGRPAHN